MNHAIAAQRRLSVCISATLLAACGGGNDVPPAPAAALPAPTFLPAAAQSPSAALAAPITLFTIGDSTVQNYSPGYFPQTGWGMVLPAYFDASRVTIVNKAVGGTSSKSFYDLYWPAVRSQIKAGDVVTIGFGINDALSDPARHTDPFTSFQAYLTQFVNEVRARGATPVLVATQPRNLWSTAVPPSLTAAYGYYPAASRQLAASLGVPLIDLDSRARAAFNPLGQSYTSNFIYNFYLPNEYPNFPNGFADTIHFQQMGAHALARLVLDNLRTLAATSAGVGTLIPALKPSYRVTFTSNNSAGGQISLSENFPSGAALTAYARPYAGYSFVSWNGDLTSTRRILSFTMGSTPRTLHATFSGSPATYPAESASRSGAGTVNEALYSGYFGTGYVNFGSSGGTLTFNNANGGDGGVRTLRIRYALGAPNARTGQLVVNGSTRPLTFAPTGAYTSWTIMEVTVNLKSGSTNAIALKSTGNDLGNVDELTVR